MALTDDHPIRITAPEYKPAGQGELESWLNKEAEKKNEAGQLETDIDTSTDRYNSLYNEPAKLDVERKADSLNKATIEAADKARHDVAAQAFGTFAGASAVDKALLAKNLSHAASGDYESHSVLLHKKHAGLSDRVKKVIESI